MARCRWLSSPFAVALAFAAACGEGPVDPDPPGSDRPSLVGATLAVVAGDAQVGTPGVVLPDSIVVRLADSAGQPLAGIAVRWSESDAAAARPGDSTLTDGAGRAAFAWRLGLPLGARTLVVRVDEGPTASLTATAEAFTATAVSVGNSHACALRADGRAFCWGRRVEGQLGDGGGAGRPSFTDTPVPVSGGHTFTRISAGNRFTCGLDGAGHVWCWGDNTFGAVVPGRTGGSEPLPVLVPDAGPAVELRAGGGFSNAAACAVAASGEARCWGGNSSGQLGIGWTSTSLPAPLPVQGLIPFRSVEPGYETGCGLDTDGRAYCMGFQAATRQLGARPDGFYPSPVPIAEALQFRQLAQGWGFTCGLALDGAGWCWGSNLFGALGAGSPLGVSETPLPVAGGLTFREIVNLDNEETYALTIDGKVYGWGSPGGDVPQSVPVAVAPELTFTTIDGGSIARPDYLPRFCGITADGAVYCGHGSALAAVPRPAS